MEGMTEFRYFSGIRDNFILRNRKGGTVDLQLVPRDLCNRDCADPMFNLEMIRDYTHALAHPHEVAPGIAFGRILTQLYEMVEIKADDLHEKFNELLELVKGSDAYDGRRFISDIDEFMGIVTDFLTKHGVPYEIVKRLEFPVYDQGYNPDLDKLCLIVDRDYTRVRNVEWENRDYEYYDKLVASCGPDATGDLKHVRLFVTNPCFELWLALHFNESLEFSDDLRAKLLRERKEEGGEKTSFHVISEIIMHRFGVKYDKSRIDFENWLKPRVADAVNNVMDGGYCTDVKGLNKHIGSSLGVLLKDIVPRD